MGFGDLADDGGIDDNVRSNNGDIVKVLSTVMHIVKNFLNEPPKAKIAFVGSSPNRTALYRRILKTYYEAFSNEYVISALIQENDLYKEVLFNPLSLTHYLFFYIRLI